MKLKRDLRKKDKTLKKHNYTMNNFKEKKWQKKLSPPIRNEEGRNRKLKIRRRGRRKKLFKLPKELKERLRRQRRLSYKQKKTNKKGLRNKRRK